MVKTREERVFQAIANVVMIFMSLCALIPMVLLVTSSFTANENLLRDGYNFIPKEWSLENYTYIFDTSSNKVLHAYLISFLLTICGTLLGTTNHRAFGICRFSSRNPRKRAFDLSGVLNHVV